MAIDKCCKKCSEGIDLSVDYFTVCEGDCACFFHAACVNLTEDVLPVLSGNIIWMCDQCMIDYQQMRGKRRPLSHGTVAAKSIEEEVRELKDTVSEIVQTLSKIAPSDVPKRMTPCHSTPKSKHALLNGTDACVAVANCTSSESEDSQRSRCATDNTTNDANFSLFLSNIDVSASERDVYRMVSRSLGTSELERIDIIRLTTNWSDRRTIDYLSFKVVLDGKYKSRAMNPATWPVNVKFREFVNKCNNTWRP